MCVCVCVCVCMCVCVCVCDTDQCSTHLNSLRVFFCVCVLFFLLFFFGGGGCLAFRMVLCVGCFCGTVLYVCM